MHIIFLAFDWIGTSVSIVTAIATALTCWWAYMAVSAWKHQMKGGAEYQLAKDLLKATYKVMNGFSVVRHIATMSTEYPEPLQDRLHWLKPEEQQEATRHIYNERWKVLAAAMSVFENKALDAKVEWGERFEEFTLPFLQLAMELKSALNDKLWPHEGEQYTREERDTRHALVYSTRDKHDAFKIKLDEKFKHIEGFLRRKIGEHKGLAPNPTAHT